MLGPPNNRARRLVDHYHGARSTAPPRCSTTGPPRLEAGTTSLMQWQAAVGDRRDAIAILSHLLWSVTRGTSNRSVSRRPTHAAHLLATCSRYYKFRLPHYINRKVCIIVSRRPAGRRPATPPIAKWPEPSGGRPRTIR